MADTTIHQILDELARAATDHRDKGDKFERLIRAYLTTDPLYAARYSDVWLWQDWPDRKGKSDTGIDLVARERDTSNLVAIQCKFYAPSYVLQKGDIDSFFTASGKLPFTSRLLVSTTDKWSKHAEEALVEQQIPVVRLRVQDLEDSAIDWSKFSLAKPDVVRLRTKNKLRRHQRTALENVKAGFQNCDRGKLIMACGTGKTFTSLKIMEDLVPENGLVLFLVPSISLLSQTLKEWAAQSERELRSFAVCSDTKVGKSSEDMTANDLAFPATTDANRLIDAIQVRPQGDRRTTVVFSTYQSIDVVSQAQKKGLPNFHLVICDEAHRAAGVKQADSPESAFLRVHNSKFLVADKRLYMTATPKIYADESKSKAEEAGAEVASMDDVAVFGPEFHRLGFGEAVADGLLTDYKVMVLAVDEKSVSKTFQSQLADDNNELNLDDAVKIVGCWNGLSKRLATVDGDQTQAVDPHPMHRAVAFAKDIKSSKHIQQQFGRIVGQYIEGHADENLLRCEVEHVDGTFNVLRRNEKLDWLKEETTEGGNLCRILTNARCLSEGVDVPALDAVLFLNPRDSVVDVVQSVGRVMRRAEGKKYGYIILPVGVPADLTPEEALKDNKRYKVVWQVLQALRAHDDRFNALVNKIDLNKARDEHLQVIGVGGSLSDGEGQDDAQRPAAQLGFAFPHLEEWRNAIYAKIVQKVGDRRYWERWASEVAEIAERHTTRIKTILEDPNSKEHKAFDKFLKGLRKAINPSIGKNDAIDMLSQHLITKPVFDALFDGYSFAQHNPVSIAMEKMLKVLEGHSLGKETQSLEKFYAQVRRRAEGIDNAEGKQKVIYELYETFFKVAFKGMSERLGIVYTPVQIVDFIIRSADEALRHEFGAGLSDENVHVLDPFTGTGTFMVRLLQSGLISSEDAKRKYQGELHANEIVLLAYYIAAINIEEAYHGLTGGAYQPFEGIVLTDTFQLTEGEGQFEEVFPENNQRAVRQNKADIRVIIGNPPYEVGQESANEGQTKIRYAYLDSRIEKTYAAGSSAGLKRNLYDSYVRALRWASDRIKDKGIVCFISNGSYVGKNSFDGVRKCLLEEFSAVYCFNLRGDARTAGERRRKERGNVFGEGSKTSVAITLLIKNPEKPSATRVHYHDIGDYLTQSEKLNIVSNFASMGGVPWTSIKPNASCDWINQRTPEFQKFLPIGEKGEDGGSAIFSFYSMGVVSNRDAWVVNSSRETVVSSMETMTAFYNEQVDAYEKKYGRVAKSDRPSPDLFINKDPKNISWSRGLKSRLVSLQRADFDAGRVVRAIYRPFCKQWMYFDKTMNEMVLQNPRIFPTPRHKNLVISIVGPGARQDFTPLMVDVLPDLHLSPDGAQCFPLYFYDRAEGSGKGLFDTADSEGLIKREAITDGALKKFQTTYEPEITKEDVFYYIYGVLSSPEYRERFQADLYRMLPRIPFAKDFWVFSNAGRELAHWHLNYETIEPYALGETTGQLGLDSKSDYRVDKMRFGRKGKEEDRSVIVYNRHLTLTGIPLAAYDYAVNGKSAIEWIMERYQILSDGPSGIVNDPNQWSEDPRYIVDLVKRVVRISMETVRIQGALPALEEQKSRGN